MKILDKSNLEWYDKQTKEGFIMSLKEKKFFETKINLLQKKYESVEESNNTFSKEINNWKN